MRERDSAKELTLKVNIFTRYSRSISQRSSLSWITTRNRMDRKCKEWDEFAQEDHLYRHARVTPYSCHPWCVSDRSLSVFSFCPSPCVSPSPCSSLSTSTCTLCWTPPSMWTTPRQLIPAPPPTEESCHLAGYIPPTEVSALSLLGPHGPVARDANSCIFHDSKHAAGICLGTIQVRTRVQHALACQQLLLKVQQRLRFTMHMCTVIQGIWEMNVQIMLLRLAPLVWCRVISLSAHWAHHSFDSASCFASCIGFSMVRTPLMHRMWSFSALALVQPLAELCCTCAMASSYSSVSAASCSDGILAYNIWNPIMGLSFHVQIGGIFVLFVNEFDLARIALSCHFALDLLCDKTGSHDPA